MIENPFAGSSSKAGHGNVRLTLLPPKNPVLEKLSYQYPLKLIAPDALAVEVEGQREVVHTVFLLTYGGGLVAGDEIDLHISLAETTKLVLLTQGSTKIFKSEHDHVLTKQRMSVSLGPQSALCYLPDPVQPFAASVFQQRQEYEVQSLDTNLCVLDWVCEGRLARGESWDFQRYTSSNEIWLNHAGRKRLLLRDNLILEASKEQYGGLKRRMHGIGAYGTLILGGAMFQALSSLFLNEFSHLPRIGAKQWDADSTSALTPVQEARAARIAQEKKDGILWTAASSRGFVVVKFGAREAEGGKRWLSTMLKQDGTVPRHFGEGSLLCMR